MSGKALRKTPEAVHLLSLAELSCYVRFVLLEKRCPPAQPCFHCTFLFHLIGYEVSYKVEPAYCVQYSRTNNNIFFSQLLHFCCNTYLLQWEAGGAELLLICPFMHNMSLKNSAFTH